MAMALKKQRKRHNRIKHQEFCARRNAEQGHTGGLLSHLGAYFDERPVGIETPSFHTPATKKRIEKGLAEQSVSIEISCPELVGAQAAADAGLITANESRWCQIETLNKMTVKELREMCKKNDAPVRSHDRKPALILMAMGEHPRQSSTIQ